MENYQYRFTTSHSPKYVYDLLLDVKQWWSGLFQETITGNSEKLGDEFSFEAGGGAHFSRQQLIELIPLEKIVWSVQESHLSFLNDPDEWNDTLISFDLFTEDNKTVVLFTHQGLAPEIECYDSCSSAWTQYLHQLEIKLSES